MKILITGGGGFLGLRMAAHLAEKGHALRLMGRKPIESPHESCAGDVTKLADVRQALEGMDALVINHMAPRDPDAYATPELCFDINVKGTANLFFAAREQGIRKVVLISSTGTADAPADIDAWCATVPLRGDNLYTLTKGCQEAVAEHYARAVGMQVAALRVGYIVDADQMKDKYGRGVGERAPADTDPRDVGEVVRLCLEREDIGFEVMVVMSTRESLDLWNVRHTTERLGWKPRFDFDRLRAPGESAS